MTDYLLHEFSHQDLDWLLHNGQIRELSPKTVLRQPDRPCHEIYLLLEGSLSLAMPYQNSGQLQEFLQLTSGELTGAIPYLETLFSAATIQAIDRSCVLCFDRTQLADKLTQDIAFSAHFYRAQAVLLWQRLQFLAMQMKLNPAFLARVNLKEAAILFAELQDQDLDWLIAVGQIQMLANQTILQPRYHPIEALHIVLEGALSLQALDDSPDAIAQVFLHSDLRSLQELARLARGDLFGETLFLQPHPSYVQIQALRETQLLSIPRWRLAAKLLHDDGFAMRFYRVLAGLMASKYQAIVSQLGFVTHQETLEVGDSFLSKMAMAEARFDWMLKRIKTQSTSGREIQWSFN
ncbi:MAG: cyclic nucleotide-binding domain-containing protein [Synechococcales bacterium]|nr:cyclic nucleotide-binding domain-containing protein [Synechococcales bacterium]